MEKPSTHGAGAQRPWAPWEKQLTAEQSHGTAPNRQAGTALSCAAFPMTAWNNRPHLCQFAVLVLHDDLVLLQFLQLGLGGHLLKLQLLPGTFLLLQLLLEFLKEEEQEKGM